MKKAIIITSPSGGGKGTLTAHLAGVFDLGVSISATTRAPRTNNGLPEQDGVEYHFLSNDMFVRAVEAGEFLEWEEVYTDKYYGTLAETVEGIWSRGQHVLFDVEVKGAEVLKTTIPLRYPDADVLSIFIDVPSLDVLESRLRGRGQYKEEDIADRLHRASMELAQKHVFDEIVMNDDLEHAKKEITTLVGNFLENGR